MTRKRAAAGALIVLFCAAPAGALDIDRKTFDMRYIEHPLVAVDGLDFSSLRVELGYGDVRIGEPRLRTTTSICVPEESENRLKDAVQLPTHYYEVPYRTGSGVMVLRDGAGTALHSERLEALESYERFGYDRCAYLFPGPLEKDYAAGRSSLREQARESARQYFERIAGEALDDSLFFRSRRAKLPVYTFADKRHDYADLAEAAALATAAYGGLGESVNGLDDAGRSALERAVRVWEAALAEADFADKTARINRKVAARLHESVGVSALATGDHERAVEQLQKALRLSPLTRSRSDGSGTPDLFERAERRRLRAERNAGLPADADIEALMRSTDAYRGRVPLHVLPERELARLEGEHDGFSTGSFVETLEQMQADREAAIATGRENRYEHMVGHSAMQGFFLFLMPFPEKLQAFPDEVCQLRHLNRLRVENHGFDGLPEAIGELTALEVLDLSGNRLTDVPPSIGQLANLEKLDLSGNLIESLPDSIGRLNKLKTLQLKGNPLAADELSRLKRLLPGCKIKS